MSKDVIHQGLVSSAQYLKNVSEIFLLSNVVFSNLSCWGQTYYLNVLVFP